MKTERIKKLKSNSGEVILGGLYGIGQVMSVVVITLSAIVMSSANDTISQAQYASYCQQFGDFSDQVRINAAITLAETGKNGKIINNAQKFHMTANGFTDLKAGDNEGTFNMTLPVGYVIPDAIQEALSLPEDNKTTNDIVAYLITDQIIDGYEFEEDLNFYGDTNGTEHHLVTSNGRIFTIPGFPEKQDDGTTRYYITSQGHYYTVGKSAINEPIQAEDFNKLYGKDFNNNVLMESPVYDLNLDKKITYKK